jgi:peptidoglycan/xylan/chitin deacetylase (PgdA/CDA1 family)
MLRRTFLATLGAASVTALTACTAPDGQGPPAAQTHPFWTRVPPNTAVATATSPSVAAATPSAPPPVTPAAPPTPPPPARVTPPVAGTPVFGLPVEGPYLAWTVDDGANSDVIGAYARMARDTGTRLTFFPNGQYQGWAEHAALLRPMVESGQIDIGNHTFSHTALTKLSDQGIIDELSRNDDYLNRLFGVSPKPFYRPPYGFRNQRTDAVAASIGYSIPVMWYGSLADSAPLDEEQLVRNASEWFLPQHIVIGHANYVPVTHVFPQLLDLISQRGLRTVTLRDVYSA